MILRQAMFELLNEIKNLPDKVTDPNWLDTLDGDASPPQAVGLRRAPGTRSLARGKIPAKGIEARLPCPLSINH